jgi:PAS domain-containing protein
VLLDTPAEESFDRLTRLASRILRAPVALVSLVDEDRQFFKSCIGLPEPWSSRRQTPLSHSFCQYTIASGGPLVVEDAREHPLLADNAAIRDLGVVAYAGIPLVTPEGDALGTFCVIDTRPRAWSAEEIGILRDLAGSALTEIALRAEAAERRRELAERTCVEAALEESAERLRHILEAMHDAFVAVDEQGMVLDWNSRAEAVLGWPREEAVGRSAVELIVPPLQRQALAEPMVDALREQISTAIHFGHLAPGDRLPSMREVARTFGESVHTAMQAYETLAAEGLVEKQDRSGVYVAAQDWIHQGLRGETHRWLADVLAGACDHLVKIPHLPELIRRSTDAARLQCACVESDLDHLSGLCAEAGRQFGFVARAVRADELPPSEPGNAPDPDELPDALLRADLVLTTVYHAPRLRPIAAALRKPLVVATAHTEHMALVEARLREGALTVVCTDPRFGERLRAMRGGRYRERVRVVLADDSHRVAELDRAEPVLLTRAASDRLEGADLRLLVPFSPMFAPACSRALVEQLILLNVQARRV